MSKRFGYNVVTAGYYDLFNPPWSEVERQRIGFFHHYAQSMPTVLDVGAGTGLIALPLAADRISVTCLESSPEMRAALLIKAAQQPEVLPYLTIVAGNAVNFHLNRQFSLIYACYMFHNLLEEHDQLAFLHCVRDHLASEGRFILTANFALPEAMPLTLLKEQQVGDLRYCLLMEQSVLSASHYEMRFVYEQYRENEQIDMHVVYSQGRTISYEQLMTLCRDTNLKLDVAYSDFHRQPYSNNDSRFIGIFY